MHLQNQDREPKLETETFYTTPIKTDLALSSKTEESLDLSKTHDHIKIKIKISNPSQEPPASSKAPDDELKDMDVLFTFKIRIGSQNSKYG